jgi:hypothetical protein
VGVAVAGATEISAGLLLYSTDGFLPALTLILTVETGALALGLWTGTLHLGGGAVEQVRRRWLFVLVTFAVAAAFSTGMTFMEALLTGGIGQGLGLALLGSLPLFALGSLLGAMARLRAEGALPTASIGVPSVLGLALGFLLTGGILLPNLAPYTLYLVFLTSLSGAALLQGWVLEQGASNQLLGLEWTPRGDVKVEIRPRSRGGGGSKVILEAGRIRGGEDLEGGPERAWERAVLAALKQTGREAGPILYVGGGSGTVARILAREYLSPGIVIVEGQEALVRLARKHLHPFPGWSSVDLRLGEVWPVLAEMDGAFSVVLVDAGILPSQGRLPAMGKEGWSELARLADPAGCVVLGGIGSEGDPGRIPLEAFTDRASSVFSRVAFYQGEGEGFLLLSGPEAPGWPQDLPGFRVVALKEG